MHRSKQLRYSITSSAKASSEGGTVRPSILAVWWLITSSNLVDTASARWKSESLRLRPNFKPFDHRPLAPLACAFTDKLALKLGYGGQHR